MSWSSKEGGNVFLCPPEPDDGMRLETQTNSPESHPGVNDYPEG